MSERKKGRYTSKEENDAKFKKLIEDHPNWRPYQLHFIAKKRGMTQATFWNKWREYKKGKSESEKK